MLCDASGGAACTFCLFVCMHTTTTPRALPLCTVCRRRCRTSTTWSPPTPPPSRCAACESARALVRNGELHGNGTLFQFHISVAFERFYRVDVTEVSLFYNIHILLLKHYRNLFCDRFLSLVLFIYTQTHNNCKCVLFIDNAAACEWTFKNSWFFF